MGRRDAPPWAGSVTPVGPPPEAVPHTSDLAYAGAVTGIWSGVLSLLVYLLARLLGVPMEIQVGWAPELREVSWLLPLLVPIACAMAGALLTALLLGRRGARRIAFWVGTAVAAASLWIPLVQPSDVLWSTRIWLSVMHVITWFLVVPQLARIVGDSEPGQYELR